jgi:hypothetical protein
MIPHGFFGLSWAEIAAVLGIIGLLWGAARNIIASVKREITEPITKSVDALSVKVDGLGGEHKDFNARLNHHGVRLNKHDYEIGTLYHTVGLPREKENDDED